MTTAQTAQTQYVLAKGINFAYRRLGSTSGLPLVMLSHFRSNMDFWDPLLLNEMAKTRPVIILDNAGVGRSGGEIPVRIAGWADNVISLLAALDLKQVDLLGFSMGGWTAQMVALNAPSLVRKLILAGTGPSMGPDFVAPTDGKPIEQLTSAKATNPEEVEGSLRLSFFSDTDHGAIASKAYWKRMIAGREVEQRHASFLDEAGTQRQVKAQKEFLSPNPQNSYDRLHELEMPVFVANGDNDLLIPTTNSYLLTKKIANAHLHIYPDAGHGFLYQYAVLFVTHINLFLNGRTSVL